MKKILALLLVLFVAVTIFAACGEKKDDTVKEPEKTEDVAKTEDVKEDKTEDATEKTEPVAGNMFENKLISFALPEGFTAKEDQGTINVSNPSDPLKAIIIVIQENNPAPIDEVAKMTADIMKSSVEDAKIGNYDYKKITTEMMGINVITLMASNNGNLFSITINGMDDPGIASIVESIVLK